MNENTNTATQPMQTINLNQDTELQYWKEHFNVTSGRLRKAVKEAGPSLTAIQEYLKNCMFS